MWCNSSVGLIILFVSAIFKNSWVIEGIVYKLVLIRHLT